MISDTMIKRISRRHFRFEGIEPTTLELRIVNAIVKDCIKTDKKSKPEKDKISRKFARVMLQ